MRYAWIVALAAVAGCTSPALSEETYTLDVHDAPTTTASPFTFHLHVDGERDGTSDHIGAHYWNQSVDDPAAAFAESEACAHQEGDLPGEFEVTCTIEPGTWYVRGHVRITDGEDQYNYWADEFVVEVTA